MTKKYFEYLKSIAWRNKRIQAFRFHGRKCSICGAKRLLQVHHKTYDHIFNEPMEDLVVLCIPCHKKEHGIKKVQKKKRKRKRNSLTTATAAKAI